MQRKTLKQIIVFVLVAATVVTTFAACSSNKKEPEVTETISFAAKWVINPVIDAQAIDALVRADFNEETNHYDISYADCFRIMSNGKYGIINLKGEVVVEPEFDELFAIRNSDDFLGIKESEDGEKTQKYIHSDTFNTETAYKTYNSEKYEYYWNTDSVKAVFVQVSGGDAKEKDLAPSQPEILKGVSYSGNKFTPDGTYGLYCNSENVTGMRYTGAGCFSDGKAAFRSNGKWGYLDSTGKTVIPFEYDAVWGYSALGGEDTPYESFDGYVTLCKDKKFGIMRDDGTVVADFIYDGATPVVDGKAFVKSEGKWGLISVDGTDEHIDVTTTTRTTTEKVTTEAEDKTSTTENNDDENLEETYEYPNYPTGDYVTYNYISLRSVAGGPDDTIIMKIDGTVDGASFHVDRVDGDYGHITYDGNEGWVNLNYAEQE